MTGKLQEQPHIRLYLALAFLGAMLSISLVCRFDVGTPVHSQTALFTDNFEDGNANGWSRSGGTWSIVTDGSRAFNQSGTGSDSRVRAGATSWTNYAVQARVKPLAFGGAGRYVALIARAQNTNHFYYLALQNGNQLVLAKRDGGTSTTLASRSFTVSTGTFYTLRIEAQGSALRAFVNGALQLSANDSQYSSGNIGVATFFASGRFDDVAVTTLGGVTPTPTPTPTPGPGPTPTPTPGPGPTPTPTPPTGTPDFRLFGFATQNGGTTGGRGGATVTVTTLAGLQSAATSASPMIVRISGRITGNTEVRVTSNKTIVGVGATGELVGIELNLVGSRNIIIRNLKSSRVPASNNDGDIIHMDDTQNVWVDHCEFFNEDPRVQTNVDFYDGLIDITHECSNITISWNYFHDSWKTTLVGSSDSDASDRRITFHHNFYETVNSRLPSYRGGVGHVYNNYYFDVITSGINSRVGACLRIEGNVFERVDDPITTLDSDVIGRWDVRDNRFINSTGSQPTTSNCSFTPPYSYPLDNSANVKAIVQQWSGVGIIDPLQGLP